MKSVTFLNIKFKISNLLLIFCVILLSVSNAKASSCNEVSDNPLVGTFTKECINSILTNYITFKPNGFFVISISEEKNVYVQGARDNGNLFLFEAVGSKYSGRVTPKVMKSLINLGWSLPGESGNFNRMISVEHILSQKSADLIYQTLVSYKLDKNDISLTYFMGNF